MAVRKTIILTEQQEKWVQSQVASGDYADDSDYVTNLIRRDQESAEQEERLHQALQEGLDSGISDRTVEEIWREAEERHKARNG